MKSRRKIFQSIETNVNQNISEEENEFIPTTTLVDLVSDIYSGGENVDEENIKERLKYDASELGLEQLTTSR